MVTDQTSGGPVSAIETFLATHAGTAYTIAQIAAGTGLSARQVSGNLSYMARMNRPGLIRLRHGVYKHDLAAWSRTLAADIAVMALGDHQMPKSLTPVVRDPHGRFVVSDERGEVWLLMPAFDEHHREGGPST